MIDALTDDDLRAIGRASAGHRFVTGGSGVAMDLPANLRDADEPDAPTPPEFPAESGRKLVLAGSCSTATRAQIALAEQAWPSRKLDVDRLAADADVVGEIARWAVAQTRLYNAGFGLNGLAMLMGWTPETSARMLAIYAAGDPKRVDPVLVELNQR